MDFSDLDRCVSCGKTREEAEKTGGCIMCLLSKEQREGAERLHREMTKNATDKMGL